MRKEMKREKRTPGKAAKDEVERREAGDPRAVVAGAEQRGHHLAKAGSPIADGSLLNAGADFWNQNG